MRMIDADWSIADSRCPDDAERRKRKTKTKTRRTLAAVESVGVKTQSQKETTTPLIGQRKRSMTRKIDADWPMPTDRR